MKIFKAEIVSINVAATTTATKFYFPDNSTLRTTGTTLVKTKAIEFYPSEAVGISPDGIEVMSSVDIRKGYLVLYVENGEYIKLPLSKLVSVFNNTTDPADAFNYPHIYNLADLADVQVNWPKSYVFFPSALAATGVSILCNVYYDFYNQ